MAGQASLSIDLTPLVLSGVPFFKGGTLETNGSRSGDLAQYTVMSYKGGAVAKWVPLTDIDALDGSNKPAAIYVGPAVTEAAIQAGDVTLQDASLLVGGMGCVIDKDKLVFENSLTLDSDIDYIDTGGSNGSLGTIEQLLRSIGIFMGDAIDASE